MLRFHPGVADQKFNWRLFRLSDEKPDAFAKLAHNFSDWILQTFPTFATFTGAHAYDDRLQDMSSSKWEDIIRQVKQFAEAAEMCAATDLNQEIDLALIRSTAAALICSHEKLRIWTKLPSLYLREVLFGPYLLLIRDFAPLADRIGNLVKRLRYVPMVLEQAASNLDRPPAVWTDTAMREVSGGIKFFEQLPQLAAESDISAKLRFDLGQAGEAAAQAMKSFQTFLGEELMPRSDGDFAVGESIWNEITREEHLLDADARQILSRGNDLIESTRAELEAACRSMEPNETPQTLVRRYRDQHPGPGELLDVYKRAVEASRDFVVDRGLVAVPENEALEVQETPSFQRPIIPYAAYVCPGAFEKEQRGFFWVTPVDADLPLNERRAKLRSHSYGKILVVALHEGYPGHHLQLVWSNKVSSSVMKVANTSALFVEGWAFYCEEMMDTQGFLTDPAGRIFRLADQLWRAYRIIIDVGLHCDGMSFSEAVRLLIEGAGLEKPDAEAEVRRYTQDPTQPMCYLIGKEEILNIVADYRKRWPERDLRRMHDDILHCGSLPPKLLQKRLFAED